LEKKAEGCKGRRKEFKWEKGNLQSEVIRGNEETEREESFRLEGGRYKKVSLMGRSTGRGERRRSKGEKQKEVPRGEVREGARGVTLSRIVRGADRDWGGGPAEEGQGSERFRQSEHESWGSKGVRGRKRYSSKER